MGSLNFTVIFGVMGMFILVRSAVHSLLLVFII
jgi:hypothetical protein